MAISKITSDAIDATGFNLSGNVGIGTTSPTNSSGYNTLSINGTTGGQVAFQTGGTGESYIFNDATDFSIYNSNAGSLKFYTNATERVRILSGGGITFNGDTAAANALDDYEEGSWTPSIVFGSTAATTNITRARYIKVGSLVSLSATITCASTPASGSMIITNIPFTPNVNVETTGNVMCNNVNTETGTVNLVTYHYNLNNTSILVYGTRDNSTWYNFTDSHVSSGDQFIFTHTYYIS